MIRDEISWATQPDRLRTPFCTLHSSFLTETVASDEAARDAAPLKPGRRFGSDGSITRAAGQRLMNSPCIRQQETDKIYYHANRFFNMAAKRDNPYVWVTWVTKLIAGEAQCQWAAWFRANHQDYKKVPSDFDLAKWTAEHTGLVQTTATELRNSKYLVALENQNSFRLAGKSGVTLAGKADLVAALNETVCIVDCKTGTPKHSDKIQVMIYLLVFPLVRPELRGKKLIGRVCYKDHSVEVPIERVDDEFKKLFRRTMESMAFASSAPKVPSFSECRFCDIDISECAERVSAQSPEANPEHDLF